MLRLGLAQQTRMGEEKDKQVTKTLYGDSGGRLCTVGGWPQHGMV